MPLGRVGKLLIALFHGNGCKVIFARYDGLSRFYKGGLSSVPAFFFALCLILQISIPAAAASAAVEAAYQNARGAYHRISKTDPNVNDLPGWERAATELLAFVREYDDPDFTPRAMYLLGRLYEHTYRERQLRAGYTRAVYFYSSLAEEYPSHSLADDALLLLGDIKQSVPEEREEAVEFYQIIVARYPQGDMVEKAKARLTEAGEEIVEANTKDGFTQNSAGSESGDRSFLSLLDRVSGSSDSKEVFSQHHPRRRPVIVIDPGHGGSEDGAIGVDGVKEKDVVLTISLLLEELLTERLRAEVVLTRRVDEHVPLAERTKIANDHGADLFISVHANASAYRTAQGIETYYLDNTDDKSSLKLAERENASLKLEAGGDDLGFILSDLIQNAKLDESISLAHYIQKALYGNLGRYYRGVKNLGVKRAPFYVLVGAHMPCVLVEVSFIDHPVEGKRLGTRRYQKLVAAALYDGVRAYFEHQAPSLQPVSGSS